MNASYKSTATHNPNIRKPFCLVCKNAGKTEKEYTSHFTKSSTDKNATITCPTILNSICTYCKNKGHFKSNCTILKEKEKEKEKEKATMAYHEKIQKQNQTHNPIKQNSFDILREVKSTTTNTTNTTNTNKKEELFPELVPSNAAKKSAQSQPTTIISYSKIAEKCTPSNSTKSTTTTNLNKEPQQPKLKIKNVGIKYNLHHDWSDDQYWSDDYDMDDDEYDHNNEENSAYTTEDRMSEDDNMEDNFFGTGSSNAKPATAIATSTYSLRLPTETEEYNDNSAWW